MSTRVSDFAVSFDLYNCLNFFLRCINNIGLVVTAFLQDCHEATGYAWQLVGSGLDKSREINIVMCIMSIIFSVFFFFMWVIGVLLATGFSFPLV